MYHIAVYFDVPAERRQEFIEAALADGRDSGRDEPGTVRFELIRDESDPGRFYLNEAYTDQAAFAAHADGPHFKRFFDIVGEFADGPHWLIRGDRVPDPRVPGAAPLTVIAHFRAVPGLRDQVLADLAAMIEPSLAEEGCLGYQPYPDPADPDRIVLLERWVDRAALEHHFATPHFAAVAAKLERSLAEPFRLEHLTEVER
ncbi:putative quinol monooxygenase [Actinomadura fibrosa]|uniref:Quinol monooxygenase n=1 Tax=Actinomadura fibrosa TaxID=111802 RepID=A0ABW2XVH3_9ACTN|nr:putative quinol monooxygenase [Actinomadura fibrosa]